MNHTVLKNYAPQARRDFIQAVTDRAAFYGITAAKIEPVTEQGDVAIIGGRAFPASVVAKRKKLLNRIERDGFSQTMEAFAYTWFNRLVAIRFMELHGYLDHGYRVLSHPDPTKIIPEVLELAEHVDLPGLSKDKVIDLKLDGNKEAELYQMLLLAQCHALHSAMPFLFEGIDDETELVLPENLLHSDSIIRKLVDASDPEDWQEVEVLGWLYQFYISERKDEVMARKSAVPTEDIPAVTQLFTPHWIVRYIVENSLGRLWLLNRPESLLRARMPYYIEGEPETDFLRVSRPEDIRLCDPAVGSGHMLTYAFDLLYVIYEEEGYAPSEIPALILRNNLHGLDICPRATQLAELALAFKAREKSNRFFRPENLIRPRILALQDVHFAENELRGYIEALQLGDLFDEPMLRLLHQFEEATTFGSLIQPCLDEQEIVFSRGFIELKDLGGHLFLHETHLKVLRVLEQAEALSQRYHVTVMNPPYLGGRQMNPAVKAFSDKNYRNSKADLFAMFIERAFSLAISKGFTGMVTMQSWMFLSTFEALRQDLLRNRTMHNMAHLGARAFDTIGGEVVQATAFIYENTVSNDRVAIFLRLIDGQSESEKASACREAIANPTCSWLFRASSNDFAKVPGTPIAYWLSRGIREIFSAGARLGSTAETRKGMVTARNDVYVRFWYEPSLSRCGLDKFPSSESAMGSGLKWFSYIKGGPYRKWFGNRLFVVDWEENGIRLQTTRHPTENRVWATNFNLDYIFRPNVNWGDITGGSFAARASSGGELFDATGLSCFPPTQLRPYVLGFLNSCLVDICLQALNPTLHFQAGNIADLPFHPEITDGLQSVAGLVDTAVSLARADWDNFETSWDFLDLPLIRPGTKGATLAATWEAWRDKCDVAIRRMQKLETENNRLFIAAYGLDGELQPEVPEEQITLARADKRRDMAAFLSFAIGCMMGRYSLDKRGLILANSGDSLSEYLAMVGKPLDGLTFIPDEDGIIPVLDGEWFRNDIVARVHAFLRATFAEATLETNLRFIEESLGKDLRKYVLTDFYKDHLQVYKKRPIYWLFSSGKERAFQALVYLHRYHEGTLSRMRTEYVIPLLGKIASRIDQLAGDIQKATSTSHLKKLEKERDTLQRQRTELQAFDEKLRHYADQRIQLELDEGVKVNYGKFGDLLAEVKAVTGGSDE